MAKRIIITDSTTVTDEAAHDTHEQAHRTAGNLAFTTDFLYFITEANGKQTRQNTYSCASEPLDYAPIFLVAAYDEGKEGVLGDILFVQSDGRITRVLDGRHSSYTGYDVEEIRAGYDLD